MINILFLFSFIFAFEEFEDEVCVEGPDPSFKYYKLIVPCEKSIIYCGYGKKRNYTKGGATVEKIHKGVDISAPSGTEVFCPFDGRVSISKDSYQKGTGNAIIIEHQALLGKAIETRYYHLSARLVKEGEQINKGQVIGKIGNTGNSRGPHLHFEILIEGKQVDPEVFFKENYEIINGPKAEALH